MFSQGLVELPGETAGRKWQHVQICLRKEELIRRNRNKLGEKNGPIRYLRSHKNLLLSVSSLLINHSLNDGWKNM